MSRERRRPITLHNVSITAQSRKPLDEFNDTDTQDKKPNSTSDITDTDESDSVTLEPSDSASGLHGPRHGRDARSDSHTAGYYNRWGQSTVPRRHFHMDPESDFYGNEPPPPPVAGRYSHYTAPASRRASSIAHPLYAPSSVYAPPYGQMVPFASQPYPVPFQGAGDFYPNSYQPPDHLYYSQLPTAITSHVPITAWSPDGTNRPDKDPEMLRMKAEFEKLRLENEKAELEENIRKEEELRDRRDAEQRTHESTAMGAMADQGEFGKMLMRGLEEVKAQLAQLVKRGLDASRVNPQSPQTRFQPSTKRSSASEEKRKNAYEDLQRELHGDGQHLQRLKERISMPTRQGEIPRLDARRKPPGQRKRVDFASTEPSPRMGMRSRPVEEPTHDRTGRGPAMRLRTNGTMSGALPVESKTRTRNASKIPRRSDGLRAGDIGMRIRDTNGKRTPSRRFQATVEDVPPTPISPRGHSSPAHPPLASRNETRRKGPEGLSNRSPRQAVRGLEQRFQNGNHVTGYSQDQQKIKPLQDNKRDTRTRSRSRLRSQTKKQSQPRPQSRRKYEQRQKITRKRKSKNEQMARDLDDTGTSEDEAYEDEVVHALNASTRRAYDEADPGLARSSKSASPEEEESEEHEDEVYEQNTSGVMLEEPETALESPISVGPTNQGTAREVVKTDSTTVTTSLEDRSASPSGSHSVASPENSEASTATGTRSYDSDSLTVKDSIPARHSSSQYSISGFPRSSRISSRFSHRASAPHVGLPEPSEFASKFDASRNVVSFERSLYLITCEAILDVLRMHPLPLLQIATHRVAMDDIRGPRDQARHPFDTACPTPEQEASVESVVTIQNRDRRDETAYTDRTPADSISSSTTEDNYRSQVFEDAPHDFGNSKGFNSQRSQAHRRSHAPHASNIDPSRHQILSKSGHTGTTQAASPNAVVGARALGPGRSQQAEVLGASVARPAGDDLEDELAENPWLFGIEPSENTPSESDSERSFHTALTSTGNSRRNSIGNSSFGENDPRMRRWKKNAIRRLDPNRFDVFNSPKAPRPGGRFHPDESQSEEGSVSETGRRPSAPTPPEYNLPHEGDEYSGRLPSPSTSPFLVVPVADRRLVIPLSYFASQSTPAIRANQHQDSGPRESRRQRPRPTMRNSTHASFRTNARRSDSRADRQERDVQTDDNVLTDFDESGSWADN